MSYPSVFGALHQGHFRLFAGQSAPLMADLVEHLDRSTFAFTVEPVKKKTAQAAIKEFLESRAWTASFAEDGEGVDDAEPPHIAVYNRLVLCGWMVEMRDGMKTVVDLDGTARLLLQSLLDIKSGKIRSFGGEVLNVKTLIESACGNPSENAQNLLGAGEHARQFMGHLRSIASALHKVEEDIKSRTHQENMFEAYFSLFDGEDLVQDFKKLRSQNNPYRYRQQLVDAADDILGNEPLLDEMSKSLVKQGRAGDLETAEGYITQALSDVITVFSAVDRHLDLIETTNIRIDRRVASIARFVHRMGDDRTGIFMDAVKVLGKSEIKGSADLGIEAPVLDQQPPVDAASLFRARAKNKPTAAVKAVKTAPDPALLAYERAKRDYAQMAAVTPAKIENFLAQRMASRTSLMGSEIEINTLEEFFIFERLPALKDILSGRSHRYIVVRRSDSRIKSDWIECADFEIRKLTTAEGRKSNAR